ncbi:MAG: methionyl-tRNA formyltransferase [Candidatus Omnitrophota bacterium]
MKIIFFGSSDFALPSLERICKAEEVSLVVTQPDRKKGRSLKVAPTPIKESAQHLGIKVFQPEDVNLPEAIEYLKGFKSDIFIVVSFGQILKKDVLDIPRLYSVNIHSSLLPKYRGAAPMNWAIANGDTETGVTIIKMNEKMDEGDMLLKERIPMTPLEDAIDLSKKLSKAASQLIMDAIENIKDSSVVFEKQDSSLATYAPKLKKEDGLIDWKWASAKIYNRARAFLPWPGCFTVWNGKILKVWNPETVDTGSKYSGAKPGTILEIAKDRMVVAGGESTSIAIKELQVEGSRRMSVDEFVRGHRDLEVGVVLG